MVAALTRVFGVHNLALAEDVVHDAFCRALEVWSFRGMPDNPSAWLMATAKNRALDVLRRERTARTFAPELGRLLDSEWTLVPTVDEQFGDHAIKDDLLRMMFSCCHPRLPEEAQVALVLNILCGFTAGEVAGAFVATRAAIEKRITRAKKVLAGSKRLFDVANAKEFSTRLPRCTVRSICCSTRATTARPPSRPCEPSCAGRRCAWRVCCAATRSARRPRPTRSALDVPARRRLPARVDAEGDLHSLFDQDRSRWDRTLVAEGQRLLEESAAGPELTEYHVEAAIAWVHANAPDARETDWARIVSLLRHANDDPTLAGRRAQPGDRHRAARGSGAGCRRSSRSPTASDSRLIRSIRRRWESWSCVAAGVIPRGSISAPRSRWRAIRWSVGSWSSEWRPAARCAALRARRQ